MRFLVVCLLLAAVILTGCSPDQTEETEQPVTPPAAPGPTPSSPAPEPPAAPVEAPGYAALGFGENEIRMWEEQGIANVDSAEAATTLAGFPVATPSFIPEGLRLHSKYIVSNHGAGLRHAGMEPKFEWIDVTLVYSPVDGGRDVLVNFIQSSHEFNTGFGEPADLCGKTIERQYIAADPENDTPAPSIAYGWEQDGIWYYFTGVLADPLDEETIENMVCSIHTG